ncbi:MAG: glycosyltransferase family 1 protein [Candidatus Daviesbacteria bacterium]|nr:glycosyltransferase family 1 protein [Candidatus Daviesbacteria bacterium]
MKVGFDISQIAYRGGVVTYTKSLAKELQKNPQLDMKFFYASLRKPYQGSLANVKNFKIPSSLSEIFFNRIRMTPIERFLGPIDIFHSSDWIQPPTKAKKVTTYHDVVPLKYPQWSTPKIVEVHKRRLKIVEKEIDMVIAVSNATKKDLLENSIIPEEKIRVIYEAADAKFKPQDKSEIEAFKRKLKLPEGYVLAIGGVGERRNLDRIKEASKGYNLVITGETIPWLSDDDLPLLYAGASVLLYPSFYEGFGLPILEAMSCETPVITSNISSMPEVGGEAALSVNPEDENEIKKRLKQVIEDSDLRTQLIKKGLEQAKKFSWEKCAKETFEIYQQLTRV